MTRLATVALATALTATTVFAQNHPNGYAGGVINFSKAPTEGSVLIYDGAGNLVTSAAAGVNNTHGVCMDHNNRLLVATDLSSSNSAPSIHIIDPTTGANLGTLATFQPGDWLRDITVGQNGNYYVNETTRDTVFRVDTLGNISTVAVLGNNPWGGIDIDIDSGDLLVQSGATPDPLQLVARDGSTVTTIATSLDSRFGIAQDIPTGDIYSGSGDTPLRVFQVPYQQTSPNLIQMSTLANGGPGSTYSMRADRASPLFRQVIVGSCWTLCPNLIGGLYTMDVSGLTPVITGVISTVVTGQSDLYEVELLYRRNVHSNLTARGQWDIGIKIPEDANKPYVLAVSASGVRGRGVARFPQSARTAWLNTDSVTFLALRTGLAPFLVNDKGTLDGNGEAIAKLDMSLFGPSANGIRLWFLAVTIDANAPDGIATITDPHVIKLEGL